MFQIKSLLAFAAASSAPSATEAAASASRAAPEPSALSSAPSQNSSADRPFSPLTFDIFVAFARWEAFHRRSGGYAQNQPRPMDDAELAAEIEANLVVAGELFKLAGSKKAKATFTLAADLFASRFDDDGMRRAYLILSTLGKNKVPILEAHPESPKISNLTGVSSLFEERILK